MDKKTQAEKNLQLMEKLTKFLLSHPEIDKQLPVDASLVILSAEDKTLNEVNDKLIPGLLEEGKHVVKAQEIKSDTNKWEFSTISAEPVREKFVSCKNNSYFFRVFAVFLNTTKLTYYEVLPYPFYCSLTFFLRCCVLHQRENNFLFVSFSFVSGKSLIDVISSHSTNTT